MLMETARLIITDLSPSMAGDICRCSQDEDNRRFVPDEVYDTPEEAAAALSWLIQAEKTASGPFVYAVKLKNGAYVGHVQACAVPKGFEVGYHIAKACSGKGYATEAVRAFAPAIMARLGIRELWGIVLEENHASWRVLEKCGFALDFQGVERYQGRRRSICRYVLRGGGDNGKEC